MGKSDVHGSRTAWIGWSILFGILSLFVSIGFFVLIGVGIVRLAGSGRSGGQSFGYNGSNLERLIQGRVAEIRRLPPDSKELCAQALLRERPDFFMPREVGGQTPHPPDQQTLELAALGIANAMSE